MPKVKLNHTYGLIFPNLLILTSYDLDTVLRFCPHSAPAFYTHIPGVRDLYLHLVLITCLNVCSCTS